MKKERWGSKPDETQVWHKKWCISEFETPLEKANVLFLCRFFWNLIRLWTKLRVLVHCFLDFTENSICVSRLV
jgi:hypothetical protein